MKFLKFTFLPALLFFSQISRAAFTQVVFPVTGSNTLNTDVVANGVGSPVNSTTGAYDVTGTGGYVLLDQTFKLNATSASPTYYLPANGVINSSNTPGLSYQLAGYSGNNSFRITGTSTSTLNFPSGPSLIGDIYLLGSSGSGATSFNATVNFVGGGSQTFTGLSFADWFNGTPVAAQGFGRVSRSTAATQDGTTANPRFYEIKLTLSISNYSKQIASITFTKSTSAPVLNIMAVTVDVPSCIPVQNLASANITTVSADLSWGTVAGSQGYEYALTTAVTPPASGTLQAGTVYNASSLTPGTTYYMHVRNKCGTNAFSPWNTASFSTLACPGAGMPVIAPNGNVPGSVTFSWPGSTTPGVVNYEYAVTPSATAPSTWQTTTATSATVTGLTPGNQYYAHVRTNCGTKAASQNVSFINPFPPCYQPAAIITGTPAMHAAQIKWNASTGNIVSGYQYAVTTSNTAPASGAATTDTFYTATGLMSGTQYYVYVRTHCGTTNYSPWIKDSFMTAATCQSGNAALVSNITSHSASISWDTLLGAEGYEYLINNSPASPSMSGLPVLYNFVNASSLNSGTNYYFHLRVKCDAASYSPWVTTPFTTPAICTAPSMPTLSSVSAGSASFNWSSVPGIQYYEYGVSTSAAPPSLTNTTQNNQITVLFLHPNTAYYFHVRASCSVNDTSEWKSLPFSTVATGTGSIEKEGGVQVYPNPVKDVLKIMVHKDHAAEGKVTLYDVSGKVLKQLKVSNGRVEIDMRHLAAGMYLLRYQDGTSAGVMRIMKQ